MNNEDGRTSRIGRWLLGIFLFWPIIVLMVSLLERMLVHGQFEGYVAYWGSPVLVAILVGIALRHYPATRTFLKVLVTVVLVVTLLGGGFYHCATLAQSQSLHRTMVEYWSELSDAKVSISIPSRVAGTLGYMTFLLPDWLSAILSRLPIAGGYLLLYAAMPAPYYLLLMLITPPFLAFPLFWLWMLLSVLYVFLPQQDWRWIRDKTGLLWKRIFAGRN